jgi:hypothetical protein
MQQAAVDQALASGAPITCATCRFFHEGNMACGKSECGGPGSGRDFPSYDGLIPRENFIERCLVCGSGGALFLIVGLPTKFALCGKHRRVYEHVGAAGPGALLHPVTVIPAL